MTLDRYEDPKEIVAELARDCADVVNNSNESNEKELSDVLVASFNRAIKFVTPVRFFKMVCRLIRE